MDLSREQREDMASLLRDYRNIRTFLAENPSLSLMQFDYAVAHGLALFMLEPDFSYEALEKEIDTFLAALPSVKRIFAKPRIHLKEKEEILPTESVRVINNKTIRHILSHTELWTDIEDGAVKPAKLLTRVYEDNYGIYENIVFCQTVDGILSFVRSYMRFFKELVYTNETIEINFLERVNHLNYFLALGKLHIGYSRSLETYYPVSMRCMEKLQRITDGIAPHLKRPVYKKNKFRPEKVRLRKTNILSMDKDYRQIYKLAKLLQTNRNTDDCEITEKELAELQEDYVGFCEMLCVFAISHFNFVADENAPVRFSALDLTFNFHGWRLKLERGTRGRCICIKIKKDTTYTVVLVPSVSPDEDGVPESIKRAVRADEYVFCTPYEEDWRERSLIGIAGIESFRRIQQIVLRGMIYSDAKRDACPFCHNTLTAAHTGQGEPVYECNSCRTQIFKSACPDTGRSYFYTKIAGYNKTFRGDGEFWLYKRREEAQMFFRNITELGENMEIICPHCRRVHGEEV